MADSKLIGKFSLTTALATLIAVLSSPAAQALVIDFEESSVEPNDNEDLFLSIRSRGFSFVSTLPRDQTQYALGNNSFEADNGTTYLIIRDLVDDKTLKPLVNPLIMSSIDETPFSLTSLDFAEWGESRNQAQQVEIIGFLAGGGSIRRLISFDRVFDGSGPLEDFQTVTFDQQWSTLISVQFKGINAPVFDDPNPQPGFQVNSFAIDNIDVGGEGGEPNPPDNPKNKVPEPTSILGILALGVGGFVSRVKKK